MTPFLMMLPWLALVVFGVFVVRIPRALPHVPRAGSDTPLVSIVVPARNESMNIVSCLESLAVSEYPAFEVIVVDDRSEDATGELARSVDPGRARRLEVVDGERLPEGWLGKPWACAQGAARASGDLLLFTDADTTHGPLLLGKAVAALEEDGADLLTLTGRQLMESFWERLVQPHIFFMMLIRFPDFERTAANDRWRDAIANGQFMLFTRSAYARIQGHESVRDEVVEDLALAQQVKRAGLALRVRSAEADLATRMYRSLTELVNGWTKNIVTGGLQSFPGWMRPFVPPVAFTAGIVMWLAAPCVLLLAVTQGLTLPGLARGDWIVWAAGTYGLSAALWMHFTVRMGAPAWYGALYPLAAAVGSWIFLRSWARGRTVEWKGRSYRLPPVSERP